MAGLLDENEQLIKLCPIENYIIHASKSKKKIVVQMDVLTSMFIEFQF